MQIAIIAPGRDVSEWSRSLKQHSGIISQVWPGIDAPEKVELAIAWNPPSGELAKFPNLKLVSSLGAGVDHILNDLQLPDVPVVRIVDERLSMDMSNYILMAILNYQRGTFKHYENQKKRVWNNNRMPNPKLHVGVLGIGVLGRAVCQLLVNRGFSVSGFSRSTKHLDGVNSYSGHDGLSEFMNQVDVLVNLLPLTDQTRGILNLSLFEMAGRPFFLINVARGGHLNENDLFLALDKGLISGACLDVFKEEPLPEESPLWQNKNIIITPHIASVTDPDTVVAQILDNYKRVMTGRSLVNQIDPLNGY